MRFLLPLLTIVTGVLILIGVSYPKKQYVTVNDVITKESISEVWKQIKYLHETLPIEKPIVIYFNSIGGSIDPTLLLLSRIEYLKNNNRKFLGVVYGLCYSACGSLFASMDRKYMTNNAIYLQHNSYFTEPPSQEQIRLKFLKEPLRLKHDANFLKIDVKLLQKSLEYESFIGTADQLHKRGLINGIVSQPLIEEL